jgi:flagellar biosynthesis/type III secretory pathway protein FliH
MSITRDEIRAGLKTCITVPATVEWIYKTIQEETEAIGDDRYIAGHFDGYNKGLADGNEMGVNSMATVAMNVYNDTDTLTEQLEGSVLIMKSKMQ